MIRNSGTRGRHLEHSSFWLQPWMINYIRNTAKSAKMSQSLVLYVIVLDFFLRNRPQNERFSRQYRQARHFADQWLPRIL